MQNNRRIIGLVGVALLSGAIATPLGASPVSPMMSPVNLRVAGQPLALEPGALLERHGTIAIDLDTFARLFGGIVIYRTPLGAELALHNQHLIFTTGLATGLLDMQPLPLASAPFVHGHHYEVPLRTVASLANLRVHYDRNQRVVTVTLPPLEGSLPTLSTQLVVAAAGSAASDGLHLTATVANLTGAPLSVPFASSARVAFVATRGGQTLWNSQTATRALESKNTLLFGANEAKSFAGFWPGFLTAGPGMITLRATFLSTPPVLAPSFQVAGVPLPTPTPSPSPTPLATPTPLPSASPTPLPTPTLTPAPVLKRHHHLL